MGIQITQYVCQDNKVYVLLKKKSLFGTCHLKKGNCSGSRKYRSYNGVEYSYKCHKC